MTMLMEIAKYLSIANVILVLSLLYVYAKNYAKTKSSFTFGLMLFAIVFLIQNAVCLYFSLTMMPYYVPGVESFVLALAALQTIAFAVMNYITWK